VIVRVFRTWRATADAAPYSQGETIRDCGVMRELELPAIISVLPVLSSVFHRIPTLQVQINPTAKDRMRVKKVGPGAMPP